MKTRTGVSRLRAGLVAAGSVLAAGSTLAWPHAAHADPSQPYPIMQNVMTGQCIEDTGIGTSGITAPCRWSPTNGIPDKEMVWYRVPVSDAPGYYQLRSYDGSCLQKGVVGSWSGTVVLRACDAGNLKQQWFKEGSPAAYTNRDAEWAHWQLASQRAGSLRVIREGGDENPDGMRWYG